MLVVSPINLAVHVFCLCLSSSSPTLLHQMRVLFGSKFHAGIETCPLPPSFPEFLSLSFYHSSATSFTRFSSRLLQDFLPLWSSPISSCPPPSIYPSPAPCRSSFLLFLLFCLRGSSSFLSAHADRRRVASFAFSRFVFPLLFFSFLPSLAFQSFLQLCCGRRSPPPSRLHFAERGEEEDWRRREASQPKAAPKKKRGSESRHALARSAFLFLPPSFSSLRNFPRSSKVKLFSFESARRRRRRILLFYLCQVVVNPPSF